jgi:PAS domain-containing protein
LLQELVDNLAFGITSLRTRDASRQMQEAQLISARRTELAARGNKAGIWDLDLVSGVLVWDEQMYALYGADPALKPSGVEF